MTRISKMSFKVISCILALTSLLLLLLSSVCGEFRFARHYADHMVLQRDPYRAVVWGFGETNASVVCTFQKKAYKTNVAKDARGLKVWKVALDAQPAGGPYELVFESTVNGKKVQVSLKDVLFGDVWVCGGQSNMQMTLNMVFNYRAELRRVSEHDKIRLFTAVRYSADKPQAELLILQQWSVATGACIENDIDYSGADIKKIANTLSWKSCQSHCLLLSACIVWTWNSNNKNCFLKKNKKGRREHTGAISGKKTCSDEHSVDKGDWNYFSALCWMYGRRLHDLYKVPIGLVNTNFGGTRVEAWSSPATLKGCGPYLMNTTDCWGKCGYKSGSCPGFCGKNGYCCKLGYGGCPKDVEAVANPNYHSCVKDVKERAVDEGYSDYFSVLGKRLYGFLNTNEEGTTVEPRSPHPTLKGYGIKELQPNELPDKDVYTTVETNQDKNTASGLWNAMLHPLLSTTIYGVIWYQGESNSGTPRTYNCTFPAMINGWRKEWYAGTQGNTNPTFPFGFVQLAPVNSGAPRYDFPSIRWKQTAEYGYVPNPKQQNTFMAVAMDLRDQTSPYDSIHPRDKSTIADRLVLGARALAYKEKGVYFSGPIVDRITVTVTGPPAKWSIVVHYKKTSLPGNAGIQVRSNLGFEVLLANKWTPLKITSSDETSLSLELPEKQSANSIIALRYAWDQNPCLYKLCAVYADGTDLPSPPFVTYGPFKTSDESVVVEEEMVGALQ